MKPHGFLTRAANFQPRHALAFVAPMVFALTWVHAETPADSAKSTNAQVDESVASDAQTVSGNWIGFTVGGAFISGDDAGFMARARTTDGLYGGIDSFRYAMESGESMAWTFDGHALPGLEDYELNALLEYDDLGYLKAGFRQFRTWYDATGGFHPASAWSQPFSDERSIDRGEIYVEAGLRMEDVPEITFSYTHAYRDGDKDSLSWGELPMPYPPPSPTPPSFKLVPSLWQIDEEVDTFAVDVSHTLGNTDLGLGLVYEHASYTNSRETPRGLNMATLTDRTSSDLFASRVHSVTRFNDKFWLTFGAAYNTLDTDIGGSRSYLYGTGAYPYYRDYNYSALAGGSAMDQIITNLNLMWNPVEDLTIIPALRYEYRDTDSLSRFDASIPVQPTPPTTVDWQGAQSFGGFSELDAGTGALDIRYTGIPDFVLYAKGQWDREREDTVRRDLLLPSEWHRLDVEVDEQQYTAGANWYPLRNLSLAVQGHHSERDLSIDHLNGNENKLDQTYDGGANNLRPVLIGNDIEVDGANLRVTWRPVGNVALVSRYDYRQMDISNQGIRWQEPPGDTDGDAVYPEITSGEITSNILSESITWSPLTCLHLQGSVNYVWSETELPAAAVPLGVRRAWENDYLTAGVSATWTIDPKTDLTASYNYYGASNYQFLADAMSYGLNTEEHAVNLTLTRMLTNNMIWNLRYGLITSNTDPEPDQSGGFNDFTAHMVSTGLQIRF